MAKTMQKTVPSTSNHPAAAIACLLLCCVALLGMERAAHGAQSPELQDTASLNVDFDPAPLLAQAAQLLDQGRLLESVDTYQTVVTHSAAAHDKAFAQVRMADVLALFLDRKDEALALYTQAMQAYPGQPALENALFNTAMILYEENRLEQSRQEFQKFLATYPRSSRSFTASYMVERIAGELSKGPSAPVNNSPLLHGHGIPNIRVALATDQTSVNFTLHSPARTGNKQEHTIPPGTYTATVQGDDILLNGKPFARSFTLHPETPFSLGQHTYRGALEISKRSEKIFAINILPLETYLQGVVPREMSPSWDEQALMAQAVAARSYAWFLMGKMQDKPFDVAATTASQVYGGADADTERTRKAVDRTKGMIVAANDAPVLTYFHAHSGGKLEDDANVWTADMPYYRVADDTISQSYKPLAWTATIPARDVAAALRARGFRVDSVRDIQPEKISPSGRLVTVAILTDAGKLSVKANNLRIWLDATKIKSVLCSIRRSGNDFVFSGKGYGHGVGMSQWGAQGMAKQDKDFRTILRHYYPGTGLARIY